MASKKASRIRVGDVLTDYGKVVKVRNDPFTGQYSVYYIGSNGYEEHKYFTKHENVRIG